MREKYPNEIIREKQYNQSKDQKNNNIKMRSNVHFLLMFFCTKEQKNIKPKNEQDESSKWSE